MATFQEVFDEMLKRLEIANEKIAVYEALIDEQESTIAQLNYEIKILRSNGKVNKRMVEGRR